MSTGTVNEIAGNELAKAAQDGLTLVDFWAPWCGPCMRQGAILEQVAQHCDEKARIVKVNIDDNQDTAQQYEVMAIPTLILFKDGQPIKKFTGLQSKDILVKEILSNN